MVGCSTYLFLLFSLTLVLSVCYSFPSTEHDSSKIQKDKESILSSASNSSMLTTTASYNANAAVSWANNYCDSHDEWLCAEFAARALHEGGEFPGVTNYYNYNGYNLASTSSLHKYLLANGWAQTAGGGKSNCGSKGNILIYNIDGDPGKCCYLCRILVEKSIFFPFSQSILFYLSQKHWHIIDAHTALAIGNCLRDQHNPFRCGATANYGDANIVLAKQ